MKKTSSAFLCFALSLLFTQATHLQTTSPVSARSDFYLYANSDAFRGRSGPTLQQSSDAIQQEMRKLSEAAAVKRAPKGSDQQLIGDLWYTAMDAESLNRQGLTPLKLQFDRIDKLSSTRDLMDAVADLNMETRVDSFLFYGLAWRDDLDSERIVYTMSPGGITAYGPGIYSNTNPNVERIREALRIYLKKTFLRLHNDEAQAQTSANAVFDLEARIAKGYGDLKEYRVISVTELNSLAPSIDWARYFKRIGLERTDALAIRSSAYFRNLDELIRTVPLSTWKDYLRLRLMRINVAYLDDRTLEEFHPYDRAYTGATKPNDRWRRVLNHIGGRVGVALGRQYLKVNDLTRVRDHYRVMAERLRSAFRARIEKADWMTPKTRQYALKKLDSMIVTVGFSDKSPDISTMEIRRDAYVLNMMRANKWLNQRDIRRVGTRPDRIFSGGLVRGDAAYDARNNEAILPLDFMQARHGGKLDDAFVYGRTGGTVGHEMSHGFDSNGRHFNAAGTKEDWWTPQDSAAFDERTNLLVEHFNEFVPLDGIRLNGRRTLAENTSDLTGLLIALDAYKLTDQYKNNEIVDGFTPIQRFFLAWANRDRGGRLQTREEIIGLLQFGVHSPDKERVNGTLMNVPEFYEAFDIKPGDPMYRPEQKRARIW
jgi:putative endopeptidase